MDNDIELELNKDYSFEVIVSFTPNISHVGVLAISKGIITLSFSSEHNEKVEKENFAQKYDSLKCGAYTTHFYLFELEEISISTGILDFPPNARSYYKSTYKVGYLIKYNIDFFNPNKITGFSIISKDIKKWIDNTIKQEKIIKDYNESIDLNSSDRTEYVIPVLDNAMLVCTYRLSVYHNSPDQKAGIRFPPITSYLYKEPVDNRTVIRDIKYLVSYFSFIIGYNIDIKKIEILYNQTYPTDKPTLFVNINSQRIKDPYRSVFYPLGKDLRFRRDDIPEFPLCSFNTYFKLSPYYKNLFDQFLKQQTMSVCEDRFLSIFRIVETLAYEKKEYFPEDINNKIVDYVQELLLNSGYNKKKIDGYLNAIKKVNDSKYNTETNIRRIYNKLKEVLPEEIKTNKTFLADMVKLRNDITHANEYTITGLVLYGYISILIVFAVYLLMRLVGIPEENIKSVMHRLKEMQYVRYINFNKKSFS